MSFQLPLNGLSLLQLLQPLLNSGQGGLKLGLDDHLGGEVVTGASPKLSCILRQRLLQLLHFLRPKLEYTSKASTFDGQKGLQCNT